MNKLYSEGLLDAEVYGQSDEQKKQKTKWSVGLVRDYFSFFTTGRSEIEAMNDAMFQPLTSNGRQKQWFQEVHEFLGAPLPSQMSIHRRKLRCAGWITSILKKVRNISNKDLKAFLGVQRKCWRPKVRVYAEGIDTENTEDERGKITPAYGLTTPNIVIDTTGEYQILKSADEQPDTRFSDWWQRNSR